MSKYLIYLSLLIPIFITNHCHQNSITSLLDGKFIKLDYPSVLMHNPQVNESNVGQDTAISLAFSKSMDGESVEFAFSLVDIDTNNEVNYTMDHFTANGFLFQPSQLLTLGANYKVWLKSSAADIYGITMQNDIQFLFSTFNLDGTPPTPVSEVSINRIESDRATITWKTPDLNHADNNDLIGYVIIRSEAQPFSGTLDRRPYLSTEIIGNGVVIQASNKTTTTFVDNGILAGKNYQYVVYSVDNVYNYSTPVYSPMISSFTAQAGSDAYTEVDYSWTMDRNCTMKVTHFFSQPTEFINGEVAPISISGTTIGNYSVSNLPAGISVYFGLEAVDQNNNRLTLGTGLPPLVTLSYASASTSISYITDGDDSSFAPFYSMDGSKILFLTDADNFTGSHLNNSDTQIAEWNRGSGSINYLTDDSWPAIYPSYNIDASKVLFHRVTGGQRQILEWDRGSGTASTITPGGTNNKFAVYNSDSSKIVFRGGNSGSYVGTYTGGGNFHLVEWDRGTSVFTYIPNAVGSPLNQIYSLDGNRIAFGSQADSFIGSHVNTGPYQIAEWDRGSGDITYITDGDAHSSEAVYYDNDNKILIYTQAKNFQGGIINSVFDQLAVWERSSGKVTYLTDGTGNSSGTQSKIIGNYNFFYSQADNFTGYHPDNSYNQISSMDPMTGFVSYITSGDNNSINPMVEISGNKVIFQTYANNFSGSHFNAGIQQIAEWVRP